LKQKTLFLHNESNLLISKRKMHEEQTGEEKEEDKEKTKKEDWSLRRSPRYKNYLMSMTSYFKLPEQGMKEFEVLSRASCFFIKSNKFHKQFHIVGASHVTHPWYFRVMYHEKKYDWLNYVYEEAVKTKISFRDDRTGLIASPEFECEPKLYRHNILDLVILHLKNEKEFLQYIEQNKIKFKVLEPELEPLKQETQVILVGHDFTVNEKGEEVMFPVYTQGTISDMQYFQNNPSQILRGFARTQKPSVMGMCGGPVLTKSKKYLGSIEALILLNPGLFPEDPEYAVMKKLDKCTIFAGVQFIDEMRNQIENGTFQAPPKNWEFDASLDNLASVSDSNEKNEEESQSP